MYRALARCAKHRNKTLSLLSFHLVVRLSWTFSHYFKILIEWTFAETSSASCAKHGGKRAAAARFGTACSSPRGGMGGPTLRRHAKTTLRRHAKMTFRRHADLGGHVASCDEHFSGSNKSSLAGYDLVLLVYTPMQTFIREHMRSTCHESD